MRNNESFALAHHFGHARNQWNHEERGDDRADTTEQGGPNADSRGIVVEQMAFNDEERETCDGIEAIKDQEGRDAQFSKGCRRKCFFETLNDLTQGVEYAAESEGFIVFVEGGFRIDKKGRNHRTQHKDDTDPKSKGSCGDIGGRKPIRIVHDDPEPRCDHPSPLSDPLCRGHNGGALVKIVTHLVAHTHVRHAKNGEAQIENERPDHEIRKVVGQGIFAVQLPQ